MTDVRAWKLLLPAPIRSLPADLAAVVGLVALTNIAVLTPVVRETPLRVVVGLPFVLFIPGYAFIAALFPEAGEPPVDEDDTDADGRIERMADRGIDGIERVALSFGLSIAIVPLIGLVLNFTPWGIRLVPVLLSVTGFTLAATAVAAQRRLALPEDERFRVPYRAWLAAGRSELFSPDTRADAVLNVVLVLSLILAVGSVGYAVAVPQQGESFSEFYLLTENETGELVADGYPSNVTSGESEELVVGVGNHEHEPTTYEVVVQLQRVETTNNSTQVLEREDLTRFSTGEIDHNETWHHKHNVSPTMTGEGLRLTYMLYRDEAPDEPTVETAYRELHLWVNVSESDTGSAASARAVHSFTSNPLSTPSVQSTSGLVGAPVAPAGDTSRIHSSPSRPLLRAR
ncbi:DUF1616 domain-containing protein [Halostella sp. JP-L12]|nr:DUF1616 domain-containing protein [Halostella sp. JP-L12]